MQTVAIAIESVHQGGQLFNSINLNTLLLSASKKELFNHATITLISVESDLLAICWSKKLWLGGQ